MDTSRVRICDILKTEYPDFCAYCESSGKVFVSELSNIDFVAFRTRMEKSREYITQLKAYIETAILSFESDIESSADNEAVDLQDGLEDNQTVDINSSFETAVVTTEHDMSEPSNEPQQYDDSFTKRESDITKEQKFAYNKSVEYDERAPLFSVFEVEPDIYSDVSFEELHFSVRSLNCLNRSGCKSVGDLLLKTISDLKSIQNMGIRSVNEVLEKVKAYVLDPNNRSNAPGAEPLPYTVEKSIKLDPILQPAIEAMLVGDEYSIENLSEEQISIIRKLEEAVDVLGPELCFEAYLNPSYVMIIRNALNAISVPYDQLVKAQRRVSEMVSKLDPCIQSCKVIPFVYAYSVSTNTDVSMLYSALSNDMRISQIPDFYDYLLFDDNAELVLAEMRAFIRWLDFDIKQVTDGILTKIRKNERALTVLNLRATGETLDSIGNMYGITRERVRQIESKAHRIFWGAFGSTRYDLFMIVYAMQNGNKILRFNDFVSIFGQEFAVVLWACCRASKGFKNYFYSKEIDAIIVKTNDSDEPHENDIVSNINSYISSLPQMLSAQQKGIVLADYCTENSIPMELVEQVFLQSFHQFGEFFHRGRLTVVFMCEYVLKNRFSAGFKTGDAFESDRFRQYMVEFFGEYASSITNRAIDAKVGEIGVLCDRGKYIHPDFLQVDKEIIDGINYYIENSSRSLLTYGEIFDALAEVFEGTQITNRYYLQGALKKYGCRFKTSRDFIRKVQNISFVDELEAFVEDRGIVHKSEIFAEFTSLSEPGLGQVVARSSTVFNIDNGYYIHVSSFDIQPKDYKQIRPYLMEACADIPVNIRAVYDSISAQFPDFMYRNDFDDHNKLFAALNYMFRDEFNFSRPYIAKLGVSDVTNKSVILQHIADYDQIEISELIDICEDNSIRYVTSMSLIQKVAPEYVRIDAETLMRRELTGITDETVDKAVEIITDMLEVNDYIVGAKIDDFLWYPQIELDWNEFLLENLIVQSGKVNVVYLIGDPLKHPNTVYVSDKYKDDTFDSMLIKILTDEVRKGSFMSKVEMRDWLKEEGFIEGKMPKFLERAKYFYVDGTGVHCAEN